MTTRLFKPAPRDLWRFERDNCERCHHWPFGLNVCPIWEAAQARQVDQFDFPPQWVADEDGPRCTAFADQSRPLGAPVPCPFTPDMFERRP